VKKITGFFLLACLFIGLTIPSHLFAAARGIKVAVKTLEGGKSIWENFHQEIRKERNNEAFAFHHLILLGAYQPLCPRSNSDRDFGKDASFAA
jgi:hypothetical protein